ncbi:hypothetical protein SOASR031_35030 [Leminorella grimontii]|nr:hypothetical protein SOASR031_35030 [Leminorella grimontii]
MSKKYIYGVKKRDMPLWGYSKHEVINNYRPLEKSTFFTKNKYYINDDKIGNLNLSYQKYSFLICTNALLHF